MTMIVPMIPNPIAASMGFPSFCRDVAKEVPGADGRQTREVFALHPRG
jgi:hypothetical protein